MTAYPQSMVWMKNFAKAAAPAAVCCVAATGITGGRSPGLMLGPVVGTSAGTVGTGGVTGETVTEGVDGADDVTGADDDGVGVGSLDAELVQAAAAAVTIAHAANARILRTG